MNANFKKLITLVDHINKLGHLSTTLKVVYNNNRTYSVIKKKGPIDIVIVREQYQYVRSYLLGLENAYWI